MNKKLSLICLILASLFVTSCKQKPTTPPYNLDKKTTKIAIPYEEFGGVKTIPVKLNGITMNMIYDTGCSGISLSLNEVQTLAKNGKLDASDILDSDYSTIADGSIVEDGAINIREIEIGGKDGIKVQNKRASVKLNQIAPILLGNSVLDELASVEVDNVNKTINFLKK